MSASTTQSATPSSSVAERALAQSNKPSSEQAVVLADYQLNDRYIRSEGRIFLTGTQALIAIMLRQKRLDEAKQMNTAGFISGYRGSPLGAVDQAAWQAKSVLEENSIKFLPAINEDLAATAVLGTQQLDDEQDCEVDGVFSMWYGKGPGVDRAGDALKHGNAYGSAKHGGVLVVAGDDHGCASSSMSHQSDVAFMSAYIPVLHPANIGEYLEFGAYGIALSRFSGTWVGFKAVSEVVEGGASVEIPADPEFKTPEDFIMPETGLNYRWPDLPGMQIENRMLAKKNAIRAFVSANPIDRTVFNVAGARYGIITTGKAFLDVMEALALLGIDESRAHQIGLDIYKIGLVWPLEHTGAERFMAGKEEVLVVEEKRGIIESQLKEYLYDRAVQKPLYILGKHDENGNPLISWVNEMAPSALAPILAKRLLIIFTELNLDQQLSDIELARQGLATVGDAKRVPYFCSGCPHNTSTKVPEGSKAQAGIGCHFMASWMDRDTSGLIQMGGEGVNWVAKSLFLKDKKSHIFQNLGDGTYFHSGSLAIRQSVAAGSNITYKILYNDAVAMTGGQPIDGMLSVAQMATQLVAEGVKKVVLVSENPEALVKRGGYPQGLEFFHRDEMDSVQRSLREIPGVTALIYEQGCAAEKRRKRKRKLYPDPAKRVFINELVCEGCGDCSTQSNCLSIVPNETEFGRKRMIDQSSCNKDYSCVKGFCPSFLTIEGGTLRKPEQRGINEELSALLEDLPLPEQPQIDRVFDLLVGGVGGTGVVTIGAIITMAAHLESKGASVLDFMGFAQKGGSVMSYVRLAASPLELNQVRIDAGSADAAIICDLVVGTDERALSVMREARTRVAANTSILPTADFIHNRNIDFQAALRVKTLKDRCGDKMVNSFDASLVAERLLGDTVFSNMMLLGFAWQQGMVPISDGAIIRAIELNGVAVEQNLRAFSLGRAAKLNLELVYGSAEMLDAGPPKEETLEQLLQKRAEFLIEYQNLAYAKKYTDFVAMILNAEKSIEGGEQLARAVARNLFKLMAYKDEYEVARLHSSASIQKQIAATFEGDYSIKYHLAPPVLNSGLDSEGRPKKTTFGSWMGLAFGVMQHFKVVRGTPMDLFGYTQERRMERELIARYQNELKVVVDGLHKGNLDFAIQIASFPDQIRGFGPVKEKSVKQADLELERLKQAFANA
jgi:indolepyruvate ferredoxin oxidoreductase